MLSPDKLRSRKDFKLVFQNGRRVYGRYFNLYFMPNKTGVSRWAVVVSTKVSKRAVRRNRLRRRLASLVKASQGSLQPGYDLVIVVKTDFFKQSTNEINQEYGRMISGASLLLKSPLG